MGFFNLARAARSAEESDRKDQDQDRTLGRNVTASARRARMHRSSELQEDPTEQEVAAPSRGRLSSAARYSSVRIGGSDEGPSSSRPHHHSDDDYEEDDEGRDDTEVPMGRGGGRDEDWFLREQAPGGPLFVDLIPSFGGHIALDIWLGKEV